MTDDKNDPKSAPPSTDLNPVCEDCGEAHTPPEFTGNESEEMNAVSLESFEACDAVTDRLINILAYLRDVRLQVDVYTGLNGLDEISDVLYELASNIDDHMCELKNRYEAEKAVLSVSNAPTQRAPDTQLN